MSQDKRSLFSHIFIAMMIYCGLVWLWTVALILTWPWEKTATWKPEFRLAAVCANGETCSIPFGQLADAKAKGAYKALSPDSDAGEVMEDNNWLRWKKAAGQAWQLETTASSWHFQTTVRYRMDGETPVLVEYQEINGKVLYYGMGLAALTLAGLYLRRLRR